LMAMRKNKILLIDDEKEFLDLLNKWLTAEGYDVAEAMDGKEGIAKVKAEKPDLIICDIRMPKMDGQAVLKEVRRDIDKDIPFIMLTAVEDFKSVEEAYEEEADFYLTKPVKIAELSKNVKLLLDLKKNRA